jgi:hypothetical protein
MKNNLLNTSAERLMDFVVFSGLSKNAFEERCGLSSRYLSNVKGKVGKKVIDKVKEQFPELNTDYIVRGVGPMILNSDANVTQTNINGNNFNNSTVNIATQTEADTQSDIYELMEAEEIRKPIVPTEITYSAELDLYDYVKSNPNKVELSRVIVLDLPIDMWHTVRDDSLFPEAKRGDMIALSAYPTGMEDPIPGKLHAVDTKTNGIVIRKLTQIKGGYLATAPNKEMYPDMTILKKNIIRIYRIMFLGRVAL